MEFRNPLDDADTSMQAFESDQDGISSVTERSTSPKNGGFKGKLKQAAAATAAVTRNRHPKLDNVKEIKKFMHLSIFGSTHEADEHHAQVDAQLRAKWGGILHPDTNTSMGYDIFQMILLLYLLATLPYNMAFEIEHNPDQIMFWLDFLVDCFLGFDIFLSMLRFQRSERSGELITDRSEIRKKYLKSWFVVDVVAVFPFDYAVTLYMEWNGELNSSARNEARTVRLLRIAKLTRLSRMSKLLKLANLRKLTDIITHFLRNLGVSKLGLEFLLRICALVLLMLCCMHLLGCVWLHLGLSTLEDEAYNSETLINQSLEQGLPMPDAEVLNRNWMLQSYGSVASTREEPNLHQYIDAAYWIIVTISSVGFGDILPTSVGERLFSIFTIVFGTFMYAYIVGSFTNMLSNMGQDKSNFDSKMRSVQQLMKFFNVPPELDAKVRGYYEYRYYSHTMVSHELLEQLPERLRAEVILHRFAGIIDKVPFFHGVRQDAVVDICSKLKSHSVMPNDDIVSRGEPYRELVIVTKGKGRSIPQDDDDATGRSPSFRQRSGSSRKMDELDLCIEYTEGSFFGELEFLGFAEVRSATVRAIDFTEVSTLAPADIEPILDVHIGLRRRLLRYGKLQRDLDTMLMDGEATLNELEVQKLKQRIEDEFDDSDGHELRGIWEDVTQQTGDMMDLAVFTDALESLGLGLDSDVIRTSFEDILIRKRHENAAKAEAQQTANMINFEEFEEFWHRRGNQMRAETHEVTQSDLAHDTNKRVNQLELDLKTLSQDVHEIKRMLKKLVK